MRITRNDHEIHFKRFVNDFSSTFHFFTTQMNVCSENVSRRSETTKGWRTLTDQHHLIFPSTKTGPTQNIVTELKNRLLHKNVERNSERMSEYIYKLY